MTVRVEITMDLVPPYLVTGKSNYPKHPIPEYREVERESRGGLVTYSP